MRRETNSLFETQRSRSKVVLSLAFPRSQAHLFLENFKSTFTSQLYRLIQIYSQRQKDRQREIESILDIKVNFSCFSVANSALK